VGQVLLLLNEIFDRINPSAPAYENDGDPA
jgi:hypothetical protein